MSKAGVALAIIAIIIGASGIWFGYTAWSSQAELQARLANVEGLLNSQSPQGFWYSSNEDIFTPTDLAYEVVPNMTISLEIGVPVSLYLSFTSSARILPDPASFSDILFYFMVDGVRLTNPFTRVGPYEGQDTYDYHSVSLTHVIGEASPGVHDFTIVVFSETAGNFIRASTFAIIGFPLPV
ncbi:MAG: hypothetical protein ACFFER_18705 [Candidatus Thorarchaeota archaeon]